MKSAGRSLSVLLPLWLGLFLGVGGCATKTSHRVAVDSISDPTAPKTQSYRLTPKFQAGKNVGAHALAMTAIRAALETKGLFEAPPGTRPEMLVEFDYGVGPTLPLPDGRPVVEKYLQLSARRYREDASTRARGEEIWDVRTTVMESSAAVESSLPLLAAVASDYIGRDTRAEEIVKVPETSPTVVHVRSAVGDGQAKP